MARNHARIRLDIWGDDDFCQLTSLAQWLYFRLCSHPSTNFAGVCDWRPGRVGAVTADMAAFDVEQAATELEDGLFVVIDRTSEEALIRTYIKNDQIVATKNMTKAMITARAGVASMPLRAVIIDELTKLRVAQPELEGWKIIDDLLSKASMTAREAIELLPPNPARNGWVTPSLTLSGTPSLTASESGA